MEGIDEKSLFEIGTMYGRMRTISQIIFDLEQYEILIDSLGVVLSETRESCNTFLHIQNRMASSRETIQEVIENYQSTIQKTESQIKRLQYEKSILEMQLPNYSGPVVPEFIYDKQSVGGKADLATNWYLSEVSKYFVKNGEVEWTRMKAFFGANENLYPPNLGKHIDPKAFKRRIEGLVTSQNQK